MYNEGIHKLAHGLQTPTIDNFLTNVFRARLWSFKDYNYMNEMDHIAVA